MSARPMRIALALAIVLCLTSGTVAQERSMAQDPKLDNLVHEPGTATAPPGSLGAVVRSGSGSKTILFLPGLGFGSETWAEMAKRFENEYRVITVTLPGFGGTPPLPMPDPERAPFAKLAWTGSTVQALARLLDGEAPRKVTIVAHWALASQIALRLALDHPQSIDRVILVSGVLKSYFEISPAMTKWTREEREAFAQGMGERWFRTVTRDTWDDNNFMPYDYAVNPRRGLDLWRQAAQPSLPVWIRYLLEFYATDLTPELERLSVPVLVVKPGFDDPNFYVEDKANYMRNFCHDSWQGIPPKAPVRFLTIPGSRLFVQYDKPAELERAIRDLLGEARIATP